MEGPKRLEEGLGHAPIVARNEPEATMAKRKEDQSQMTTKEHDVHEPNDGEKPVLKQKSRRVATLDAFRGLTIVLMILVDDAGGVYERIDHSPWNGCTLADFVLPFFLFIVGVAIALALKVHLYVYVYMIKDEKPIGPFSLLDLMTFLGAVCFLRGKTSAVCGPHLQQKRWTKGLQSAARRLFVF
ncbi:hypothetical protein R6Q59_007330 [Mikania micrantha]